MKTIEERFEALESMYKKWLESQSSIRQLLTHLEYPAPIEHKRPSWTDYFMPMAFDARKRSHDAQTQNGCVITSRDNRIVSTGYNGYPRGIDDSVLPNTRPHKYDLMRHAERNACDNCEHRPAGGIAYLTGESCNECLMTLWQNGIETVYIADNYGGTKVDDKERTVQELFLLLTGMKVTKVPMKKEWL